MTEKIEDDGSSKPKQAHRSNSVWGYLFVGIASAMISGLLVAAIDRNERAPFGAWISDFAKSPGFAGVCALIAASLAFWGIRNQVEIAKRNLDHQRDVNTSESWWSRFEWVSTRAVPASKDDQPLPYDAVLSTLTGLTQAATDDVQLAAVGAISEVAAEQPFESPKTEELSVAQPREEEELRMGLLQKYSEVAGNTPARSPAVDAALYEFQIQRALRRILPSENISTDQVRLAQGRSRIPDAIVRYKGKRIVIEMKAYNKPHRLNFRVIDIVRSFIDNSIAQAAIVVAPVDLKLDKSDQSDGRIATAVWTNPGDDGNLVAALEEVVAGTVYLDDSLAGAGLPVDPEREV